MNSLFDPEDFIFLSYEQESDWKKKWLELKIRILETKLKQLSIYIDQQPKKTENESFECCSRTKTPPYSITAPCIDLYPIYNKYSNPSKLVNSSYAPITPIWKIDESNYSLMAANESDSDSYFKEDHPIIYDFTKEDISNTNLNSQENQLPSSTTNQIPQEKSFLTVPKFTRQKKHTRTLITTPGWIPCDPIIHYMPDNSTSIKNDLESFESKIKKAHLDIEIVQKRIQSHQLNIPIEESNIHNANDPKVFPTNKEKKLERKYICRPIKNQVPPNWKPRSYDSPDDILNEEEIDTWKKLMKNELSKEAINNDFIDKDLRPKRIQIRTPDSS